MLPTGVRLHKDKNKFTSEKVTALYKECTIAISVRDLQFAQCKSAPHPLVARFFNSAYFKQPGSESGSLQDKFIVT